MKCDLCGGTVIDREVSYTIEFKERLHIIEHVPAKECLQCGERLYSPETVEKIQKAIWQNRKPDRFVETPVMIICLLDSLFVGFRTSTQPT